MKLKLMTQKERKSIEYVLDQFGLREAKYVLARLKADNVDGSFFINNECSNGCLIGTIALSKTKGSAEAADAMIYYTGFFHGSKAKLSKKLNTLAFDDEKTEPAQEFFGRIHTETDGCEDPHEYNPFSLNLGNCNQARREAIHVIGVWCRRREAKNAAKRTASKVMNVKLVQKATGKTLSKKAAKILEINPLDM